ncbi:MAG: hypothetical protein QNJ74_27140 [Trichodesmium sp. MO_231.B1]|nr:hypothetical protein [Trichodesmium sp. MO_231.B1]
MLVGDINFPPKKNHKPVNFNITYDQKGKCKLRWAAKAVDTLRSRIDADS